jgi:RNA polymerase-binding transcription factor DksA
MVNNILVAATFPRRGGYVTRDLAASTLEKLSRKLQIERERLVGIIEEHELEFEQSVIAIGSADRNADPDNVDGGAFNVEIEMENATIQNARDMLSQVMHAQDRMEKGLYGICEVTGDPIPVARLEALPYATTTVEAASGI